MKRFALIVFAAVVFSLLLCTAALADGLTITNVYRDPYGDVTVTWSGGRAPYKLAYYAVDGADSTVWTVNDNLYSTSGTIGDLAPNFDFVIGVVDADNNVARYTLNGNNKRFSEVQGIRLTFTLRQRVNGRSSTISQYSAHAITTGLSTGNYYGATIKLSGYSTRQAMPFTFRMAVTLPDGEPLVFFWERMDLPRGSSSSYVYWEFYDFSDDMWQYILQMRGEIPVGNYTYYIYMDDGLVASAPFTVGR